MTSICVESIFGSSGSALKSVILCTPIFPLSTRGKSTFCQFFYVHLDLASCEIFICIGWGRPLKIPQTLRLYKLYEGYEEIRGRRNLY